MPGKVESYIHSDTVGSLVRVTTQTHFAAKDAKFIEFCERIAMLACSSSAESWKDILIGFPEMEHTIKILAQELRENIEVTDVCVLKIE
jgi:translation elongation factor EF-Ts